MKRRTFLKTSAATSMLAAFGSANFMSSAAETGGSTGRDYYELRAYRFKAADDHKLFDDYMESAAIPGWNRLGIKPVGAFTEVEPAADAPVVYVLIPYSSLESFAATAAKLNADSEYQKAGAQYLQTAKDNPAFMRMDSWLMLAFSGMPKLTLPAYCKEKKPRVFELRTYESPSELKALNKIEMFNSGEIDVMREVGLAPIFYGQTLIGSGLPHLTYMTSAENRESHKEHWTAFGKHPTWLKLKDDPKFADNMNKMIARILVPTAYSQI